MAIHTDVWIFILTMNMDKASKKATNFESSAIHFGKSAHFPFKFAAVDFY